MMLLANVANVAIAGVALLHLAFLVLEMFLWEHPVGLKVFRQTPQAARASRALAGNQGLYNGFLAAGLLWGLWLGPQGLHVQVFFLGCVVVAGLYGAATVGRAILWVQFAPAAVALLLLWLAA